MSAPIGSPVTLRHTKSQRTLRGTITAVYGRHFASLELDGSASGAEIEIDTRTARPSKRCRNLSDPAEWRLDPHDAATLGWGEQGDNPRLLPTWRRIPAPTIPNPAPPEELCACGHPASMHHEELPSSCRYGKGPMPVPVGAAPEPRHVDAINRWLQRGCQCAAFAPPKRATPRPRSRQ